ncbi:MAG TPA: BTAD domain-containing putative transcriptional regulator, partial [Gemmatimonadales bacterium]|nr:BTAD domain-containing putative transcriptional regulator [Gemmatimonadales bacterium]
MISCRTLGALEVLVDGAPPPPDLKWKKPLALLLYLAYSPRSTRAKDHLISLLWPDAKEPNQSLSQAQYLLRTRGGVGIAEKSGQIRLDITTVVLDTARLEALVSKGMWADAAGLVSGPFLDGFTVRDAPEFEDWISTQREHWSAKCAEVLVRYADELTNGGATEQALPVAERAQGLAPHADSAEQVRLNALSLLGRRAEALDGYHRFEKRLKVDLGITPDAKTRELVARITDRPIRPSVPSSKKREPPRRAPLVGRQKQLKRIHDCCVRSRESGEAVLGLVLGEPGSGKTRFVEEVLER